MGIKLSLAKNYLIRLDLSRVFHRSVFLLRGPWKLEEFYAIISFHSPECTFETFECPTQFLCVWSYGKTQLSTEENLCNTEQGDDWAITMLFDLNPDQPRTVCVQKPPRLVWRHLISDRMMNSAWAAGSLSITSDEMLQKQRMKSTHTNCREHWGKAHVWASACGLEEGWSLDLRCSLMAAASLRRLLSTYSRV